MVVLREREKKEKKERNELCRGEKQLRKGIEKDGSRERGEKCEKG